MEKTKICGRCKRELPLSDFSKNRFAADGLHHVCRQCDATYSRQRAAEKKNATNTSEYNENENLQQVRTGAANNRVLSFTDNKRQPMQHLQRLSVTTEKQKKKIMERTNTKNALLAWAVSPSKLANEMLGTNIPRYAVMMAAVISPILLTASILASVANATTTCVAMFVNAAAICIPAITNFSKSE